MKKKRLTFYEYLRLGSEQAFGNSDRLKKRFFKLFGFLLMNPRIRGGRLIEELSKEGIEPHSRVLEAGFGFGIALFNFAKKYPGVDFVGYELDDQYFDNAKNILKTIKPKNLSIKQIDLVKMDDKDSFDFIYSSDVLEHIIEDKQVLLNFHKALKPDGLLLLHLPLQYEKCKRIFHWFTTFDTKDHVRDEYLPEEIKEKLEECGYSVVSITYSYGLLKGELAFEINNLIRNNRILLIFTQLLTFPLALILGFLDIKYPPKFGNSLVIKAIPEEK